MSAAAAILSILIAAAVFWLAAKYDWCATAAGRRFNADYPTRTPLSEEALAEQFFSDSPIHPAILGRVRRIFGEQLGLDPERILPDDDFNEIDSSLVSCELTMEVEEAFGVQFTAEEMSATKASVRRVSMLVQTKLNERKAPSHGAIG